MSLGDVDPVLVREARVASPEDGDLVEDGTVVVVVRAVPGAIVEVTVEGTVVDALVPELEPPWALAGQGRGRADAEGFVVVRVEAMTTPALPVARHLYCQLVIDTAIAGAPAVRDQRTTYWIT